MKFFESPDINLIIKITETMSLKDVISFLSANKGLQSTWDNVLAKRLGVENIGDFYKRYHQLDEYPLVQGGIRCGNLTIPTAEEIVHTISLPPLEKLQKMHSFLSDNSDDEEFSSEDDDRLQDELQNLQKNRKIFDNIYLAIVEGLITNKQLEELNDLVAELLKNDNAILALREKLITLEQAKNIDSSKMKCLISDNGLLALRDKLIPIEDVKYMSHEGLSAIISDIGREALRKKLISFEEAADTFIWQNFEEKLRTLLHSDKNQNRP